MMEDPKGQFGLRGVEMGHPALRFAMPLISYHDGKPRCIGTGFMVAPGLAITAAHVIEEWMRHRHTIGGRISPDASVAVHALQWWQGLWRVWMARASHACYSSEIGFLEFHKPEWWGTGPGQVRPPCARLNFNPPSLGDRLTAFGFPGSYVEGDTLIIEPTESEVRVAHVELSANMGRFRPQSHIEVDGSIAPGMSGGPCFDRDWNVVGVNSKRMEFLEGPPQSCIALPWPAMNTEIDLFSTGAFPVGNLFTEGPGRALGYRRLHINEDKSVLLARIDPEDMKPTHLTHSFEVLEGGIRFAGGEATQALESLRRELMDASEGGWLPDNNAVHRHLRQFFRELDAALHLTVRAAALRSGIEDRIDDWNTLSSKWKDIESDRQGLDAFVKGDFAWNGAALFEVRAYADQCRSDLFGLESLVSVPTAEGTAESSNPLRRPGTMHGLSLSPSRAKGGQRFLPEGLDEYIVEVRKFVRRTLRLGAIVGARRKVPQQPDKPAEGPPQDILGDPRAGQISDTAN